jgi:hypothetical protein
MEGELDISESEEEIPIAPPNTSGTMPEPAFFSVNPDSDTQIGWEGRLTRMMEKMKTKMGIVLHKTMRVVPIVAPVIPAPHPLVNSNGK